MALDADDLAAIRDHIGSHEPPTSPQLAAMYARLGSVEAVALAVVRQRLAELRAHPADLSVDGDYAEKWGQNILALERQEKSLAAAVAAGGNAGVVTVSRLTRAGRSR